jgi:hypothetical protein
MSQTVSFEAIPANLLPLLQAQSPRFRDWLVARDAAKLRLETAALEVFPAPDQAYEAARYLRSRIMRWDSEHPLPLTAHDIETVAGEAMPRLRLG